MSLKEFFITAIALLGLAAIRFGVPILAIWLLKLIGQRILRLE